MRAYISSILTMELKNFTKKAIGASDMVA
jgi:hypothetical protein